MIAQRWPADSLGRRFSAAMGKKIPRRWPQAGDLHAGAVSATLQGQGRRDLRPHGKFADTASTSPMQRPMPWSAYQTDT
jgi:hypothetical protein